MKITREVWINDKDGPVEDIHGSLDSMDMSVWVFKVAYLFVLEPNPFEKYMSQNGFIFRKDRDENKKYLKPPPSVISMMFRYLLHVKIHSFRKPLKTSNIIGFQAVFLG